MTAPAFLVQADLSGTAFGGSPSWTDITDYVTTTGSGQPISINGPARPDWRSDTTPSTCAFTLTNDDGRFTPGRAASPYYPHVLPMVRVRVTETVAATTFHRFDGYVESWTQLWDGGGPSGLVRVQASDILARFGTMQPLRNLYVEEVLVDSPVALFPLTEGSGATRAASIAAHTTPALRVTRSKYGGGDYTFSAIPGLVVDGAATLSLNTTLSTSSGGADDTKGYYLMGTAPVVDTTQAWSVEAWVKPTSFPFNQGVVLLSNHDGLRYFGIGLIPDAVTTHPSAALVGYFGAGDGQSYIGGGAALDDGDWHHIVATYDGVTTSTLYVDGVSVVTWSDPTVAYRAPTMLIGRDTLAGIQYRGGVQYAAVYTTKLSPTRVAQHFQAGATGFAGEATDAHVTRLLSYRPNTGTAISAGEGVVGLHMTDGVTLQQALLDTARAEGGLLYVDGQGRVAFLPRTTIYDLSSSLTLDASTAQVSANLQFRSDAQDLVNDVTISSPGGAGARVVDTTSQATYGVRAVSDSLIVDTDSDAADAAGWMVARQKDANPRSPQVTVDLLTEPSDTVRAAVLGVNPWTVETLAGLPTTAPVAAVDLLVEGWAEEIGVDVWAVTHNTSAVPPLVAKVTASADPLSAIDAGLLVGW